MGDQYPKLRLAAVQAAPVFLDREATVDKACRLIEEAAAGGANIIGFPESFIPGHPLWYHFHAASSPASLRLAKELFKNTVEVPGPATDRLCDAARRTRTFVVIGICERDPGAVGTMYNSLLFINEEGEIVGRHRKLVPTLGERLVHTGGNDGTGLRAYRSAFAPVSGLMCGENSNPLACFSLLAAGTGVHVASWPQHFNTGDEMTMQDIIKIAGSAFAYQTKAWVINAVAELTPEAKAVLARTDEDRRWLDAQGGGSCIIRPRGQIAAGPLPPGEAILYADATLEAMVVGKLVQDFAGHYNRFDIFDFRVDGRLPELLARRSGQGRGGRATGAADGQGNPTDPAGGAADPWTE